MKKPYIVAAAILLVVLIIGVYAYAHNKKSVTASNEPQSQVEEGWIEVTKSPVLLVSGTSKTQLTSGETIRPGATIETGSTGAAIIHFPDGSVTRIDANTSLTISSIAFDPDSNSLVVSIGLTIGRIWNKVIGLATPQSSWEVKTSNTVATVRGTAFGVGYKTGTSWVLDSEHAVAVAPINPKNNKSVSASEITLSENTMIVITTADAANASTAVSSSTLAAKITPVTAAFKADAWIRAQETADKEFDARVATLKAQGLSDAELRAALRKADLDLKSLIQNPSLQTPVAPTEPSSDSSNETQTTVNTQTSASGSGSASPTAATTVITTSRSITDLIESDTVQFKAMVGTTDVTSKVVWSVVGPIGSITRTGLFTALLSSEIAEYGEGSGTVTATLPNGEVVKSASIHVDAKVGDFIREG